MKRILPTLFLVFLMVGCRSGDPRHSNAPSEYADTTKRNSIYHWKTTFAPDSSELDFLRRHNIERLYIKMFDVSVQRNHAEGTNDVIPIATTRFEQPVPDGIDVVPVTYITIEALKYMRGDEARYADLIVERLMAMCSYNRLGTVSEIQLDCDWTSSTKESYNVLCRRVKESLKEKGINFSVTVRLHQLSESAPPANRGVLMLYNTGSITDFNTVNSILDMKDAKPYLKKTNYPIPLDYAYPVFGWGVRFKDQKFVSIVQQSDTTFAENEYVRVERPSVQSVLAVKSLVEKQLGKPLSGNISYHFDNRQLNNYTDYEIDQIISY